MLHSVFDPVEHVGLKASPTARNMIKTASKFYVEKAVADLQTAWQIFQFAGTLKAGQADIERCSISSYTVRNF